MLDIETSFVARKKSAKPGPSIAFLAEYDALPGLGHACGHNIIGTQSVAAAIAFSKVVDETGGEAVVFGTPAEEGGPNESAKGSFVRHGLTDGIDAAMMIHPNGYKLVLHLPLLRLIHLISNTLESLLMQLHLHMKESMR